MVIRINRIFRQPIFLAAFDVTGAVGRSYVVFDDVTEESQENVLLECWGLIVELGKKAMTFFVD